VRGKSNSAFYLLDPGKSLLFFPLPFFIFGGLVKSDEGGLLEYDELFNGEVIFFACS